MYVLNAIIENVTGNTYWYILQTVTLAYVFGMRLVNIKIKRNEYTSVYVQVVCVFVYIPSTN